MLAKRHRSYYTKEGYKQVYKPNSPEARSDGYIASRNATEKIGKLFHAAGKSCVIFRCTGRNCDGTVFHCAESNEKGKVSRCLSC